MDGIKKNTVCWYMGGDGTTTKVRVVRVHEDERWVTVRWMEPHWNLDQNILVHRKGMTSEVCTSNLQDHE